MKKVFKITIILMILFIMFLQTNFVKAGKESVQVQDGGYTGTGGSGQTSSTNAEGTTSQWSDQSLNYWKPENQPFGQNDFNNRAKIIVAAIRGIGIVISVVALIIIGIKQLTASVEEKSIIKQAMPGYILGVILVVSITFLPTIIYNFMQKIN